MLSVLTQHLHVQALNEQSPKSEDVPSARALVSGKTGNVPSWSGTASAWCLAL